MNPKFLDVLAWKWNYIFCLNKDKLIDCFVLSLFAVIYFTDWTTVLQCFQWQPLHPGWSHRSLISGTAMFLIWYRYSQMIRIQPKNWKPIWNTFYWFLCTFFKFWPPFPAKIERERSICGAIKRDWASPHHCINLPRLKCACARLWVRL